MVRRLLLGQRPGRRPAGPCAAACARRGWAVGPANTAPPGGERESVTNAVPPHLRRDVFRYPGGMASTRGGLISVWPCASEESESTLREADVLATAYRCTTPGCWPRGIAGVMDPFSAGLSLGKTSGLVLISHGSARKDLRLVVGACICRHVHAWRSAPPLHPQAH